MRGGFSESKAGKESKVSNDSSVGSFDPDNRVLIRIANLFSYKEVVKKQNFN